MGLTSKKVRAGKFYILSSKILQHIKMLIQKDLMLRLVTRPGLTKRFRIQEDRLSYMCYLKLKYVHLSYGLSKRRLHFKMQNT